MAKIKAKVEAKPAARARATVTEEVTIKPSLRRKLLIELTAYADLNAEYKQFKADRESLTARIRELREATGSTAIEIEGFKVRDVAGVQTTFDKQKFVALGGDLAIYEQALVTRPKRTYEKITLPGASEED